jgi:hypothetical protein
MSPSSPPPWFRRPALVIPGIVVAVGLPLMLLVRSEDAGGRTSGGTIVLGALAVLLVLAVVQVARMLAGVDPEVPHLAEGLAEDPEQRRLLARWISRARWARDIGVLCGLIGWVLGTQMQGDILVWGVGGIALGAMAAEMHHVRPSRGTRTASLDVRSVDDYLPEPERRRMISVGIVALVVIVAGFALDDVRGAAWAGLAALAVLAAARLVQGRVATRPRPAIPETLRRADDLARSLAIGAGLARPATFFALALIARGAWLLVPAVGDVGGLLGVITWLYALRLWWTNRGLGLDYLRIEPERVLA